MTQLPPYPTPSQVAEYLTEAGIPISEDAVRRWCREGKIPAKSMPGGQWRLYREDVEALLSRPMVPANP